jgi:glycosyltransferase involved in cell wall biosynthesis
MKISVVTVTYNSAATVAYALRSVAQQAWPDVEHIVVDGASTDRTMAIVQREGARVAKAISEPDEGIYDAMNKGLSLTTGDVVAFLNSDDRYADANVLAEVAAEFDSSAYDFVYGDIHMVNAAGRVVRTWRTTEVPVDGLSGTQIPHPALFVRRHLLTQLAPAFDPTYRICADIKQQLILVNKLRARGRYLRRPLVTMSIGGTSTSGLRNYLISWKEARRAYNEVVGSGGGWYTLKKVLWKLRGLRPYGD